MGRNTRFPQVYKPNQERMCQDGKNTKTKTTEMSNLQYRLHG